MLVSLLMHIFKCENKKRNWFMKFSSKYDILYYYGYDSNGKSFCTCPSYHYDKGRIDGKCKHIREAMQIGKVEHMSQYYIKSELDTLNKLFMIQETRSCVGYQ